MADNQDGASLRGAPAFPITSGVDIAGWIREGWRLFWSQPIVFVVSTGIFLLVFLILGRVPFVLILIAGPMVTGYYVVIADQAAGRPFQPQRLFSGFSMFLHAAAAHLFINLFAAIGFLLFIIPGLIVCSWYFFTYLFIFDRRMGFWQAMEASRGIASRDITGYLLYFFALIAINVIGALCLGVGLFVSIPVSAISIFAAYRNTAGLDCLAPQVENTQPQPPT